MATQKSALLALIVFVALALAAPQSSAFAAPESQAAQVRVIKRYGAAVRTGPSSDAPAMFVAGCNRTFPLVGQSEGWWAVALADGSTGWIGGARVSVGAFPEWGDCWDAITYQLGDIAYAHPTHCLSVRQWPARDAPYDFCVPYNYQLTVVNGPMDVAGEDWVQVWSDGTSSGWSLVDYLSPWP